MNDTFLKIYLPIYILLYLVIAFVIPTYKTYKATGINPITFGKEDNAHDYIGFVMKILIGLPFVTVLFFSFGNNNYQYCSPILFLEINILKIIGLALIHISLLWIAIAQYQMSNSWRIGIDEKNKTALVTIGIFSISRNPIFLGMMISVLGIFLVLPNALSLFTAVSTYFIIQIQIRLEEVFLLREHGEEYLKYKKKVKRLL
jgi:protein-S-isoprenylcysteine O-methyltransferase Ste14